MNKDKFQFEASGAPIPVMGARWQGNDIYKAKIFFHNEQFLSLYGDLRGQLLADVLENILHADDTVHASTGSDLIQLLLENGELSEVKGILSGHKVSLFARLQENSPNTIQSTVFNATGHYLDTLTQFPRRELFFDRLTLALQLAQREGLNVHLCFLDLDNFKNINDTHGHLIGDLLLKEVACRLQTCIRDHETVARLSGDEFIIMLSGKDINPLHVAENKIIPTLNKPYRLNEIIIDTIGASIGIASYPEHQASADELLSYADTAMYVAKRKGKNTASVYQPDMLHANNI